MESISSREFQADAMCHVKDVVSSAVSEKSSTSETEKELPCASACESIELSLSCTVIPSDVCNSSQLDGSSTEMDTSLPDEGRTSGDMFNLKGEFSETDMTDDNLMLVSRSGRSLRRCRRDSDTTIVCPVCKLTMRSADVSAHVQIELDKLSKTTRVKKLPATADNIALLRKKTYLRVKRNRMARHHARNRHENSASDYTSCPVCNEPINGTPEELNEHVEYCLNRVQRTTEDLNVNIDNSDDELEEYEWAGQTRVRASSGLPRDSPAAVMPGSSSASQSDDMVDLNIEDDDRLLYGQSQYSEADLFLCAPDNPGDDKNRHLLRNALLEGETGVVRSNNTDRSIVNHSSEHDEVPSSSSSPTEGRLKVNTEDIAVANKQHLAVASASVSADGQLRIMKNKLADLEKKLSDTPRCLICLESYNKPLTSIQCWHVYCEECWLRTLGAKKLCPQCNTITTPSDLRRIYL